MNFCASLIRIIMIIFNALFMMVAFVMLGVGVAVKMNLSAELKVMVENQLLNLPLVYLYSVGALIFTTTVFGLMGALAPTKYCLVSYSIIVMLLVIIEVILVSLLCARVINIDFIDVLTKSLLNKMSDRICEMLQKKDLDECYMDVRVYFYGLANIIVYCVLAAITVVAVTIQITATVFAQYVLSTINIPRPKGNDSVDGSPLVPYDPYEPETMIDNECYYNKQHNNRPY